MLVMGDDKGLKQAVEAVAQEHFAAAGKDIETMPMCFFHAPAGSISDQIRKLTAWCCSTSRTTDNLRQWLGLHTLSDGRRCGRRGIGQRLRGQAQGGRREEAVVQEVGEVTAQP